MESHKLKSRISYKLSRAWLRATRGLSFKKLNLNEAKNSRALLIFGPKSQRCYAEVLRAKKDIIILRVIPQTVWKNRLKGGGCGKKKVKIAPDEISKLSKLNWQTNAQRLSENIEKDLQCLQADLCRMKYYCSPEDLLNFCRVLKRLQSIVNCFGELKKSLNEFEMASKETEKAAAAAAKSKKKKTSRKKDKNSGSANEEANESKAADSCRSSKPSVRSSDTSNCCSTSFVEEFNECAALCQKATKNQNKECKKKITKSESSDCNETKERDSKKLSPNCELNEKCRESDQCEQEQKCREKTVDGKKLKAQNPKKKDSKESLEEQCEKKAKCPKSKKEKRSSGCEQQLPCDPYAKDKASLVTIYKAPPAVEKFCCSCYGKKVRTVKKNLGKELLKIIGKKRGTVFLKISAVQQSLYHIQLVSSENRCLGCLYVSQKAMNASIKNNDLEKYITLSLISPSDSLPDMRNIVKYPFVACK